jgi:hypothetical protein
LKQMAASPVPAIVSGPVAGQKTAHRCGHWHIACSQQQVKVVGDQRPRIASGSCLLQNRFQALNEIISIMVVIEDIATPDSARNDMVQGTGSINSGLPW